MRLSALQEFVLWLTLCHESKLHVQIKLLPAFKERVNADRRVRYVKIFSVEELAIELLEVALIVYRVPGQAVRTLELSKKLFTHNAGRLALLFGLEVSIPEVGIVLVVHRSVAIVVSDGDSFGCVNADSVVAHDIHVWPCVLEVDLITAWGQLLELNVHESDPVAVLALGNSLSGATLSNHELSNDFLGTAPGWVLSGAVSV